MSITPIEGEKLNFVAGDTLTWLKTLASYLPADGWVLSYAFVSSSEHIGISASDNGDGKHLVSINGSLTAQYKAGTYTLFGYVTKNDDRVEVYRGSFEIYPNYALLTSGLNAQTKVSADLGNVSASSDAVLLEKIKRAIEEKLDGGAVSAYSVDGRSVTSMSIRDLEDLRDKYERKVRASQGIFTNTVRIVGRP